MRPMTTSTAIILNGIIAVGLLAAVAFVMYVGHRFAGSNTARVHWSGPLELKHVRATTPSTQDLERAA